MGLLSGITKALGLTSGGGAPINPNSYRAKQSQELQGIRDVALQDLQRQASGKGPSIAKEALKAAQERSLAQTLAAAQAVPTRNVGGLQRQLVQQQGMAGRELAQTGAMMKSQEQLGAQGQLLGLTESDLSRSAGLQNVALQAEAQRRAQESASNAAIMGALLGGAGTAIAGKSDKRVKENVKPAKKEVNSFLDALNARQYNYKPEADQDTSKKYGIMAQDLEKSKMGKAMVTEKNGVKHVDMFQGFSAILAAQAELNDRMKKLEGKKKSSKDSKDE